jgi:hypothetical protein
MVWKTDRHCSQTASHRNCSSSRQEVYEQTDKPPRNEG